MREKVVMSYQGAQFRLGRGQSFVAIWPAGAPVDQPLEQWPATPDGWSAAWSRFTELEADGTIAAAAEAARPARSWPRADALLRVTNSAALLVIGVVFGAVALFPNYVGNTNLASHSDQLVPHLMYLAAWALGAVGVLAGGARARAGAALALGTSAVTLGMFVADAGQVGSGVAAGAGLILACIGWLACAAGSVLAVRSVHTWRRAIARPRGGLAGVVVMLALAGIGVAVMFALAWDSYQLSISSGQSQTVTMGNVFSEPGAMIAGNVIVMILLVVVAVLAGIWRSTKMGAMLLVGAIVPLAAQAVAALIDNSRATSPALFGYTPAQAQQIGLTIHNGLTAWFWLYCVFLVALAISAAWMLLTPAAPGAVQPSAPLPPDPAPAFEPPAPFAAETPEPAAAAEAVDTVPASDIVPGLDTDAPAPDAP